MNTVNSNNMPSSKTYDDIYDNGTGYELGDTVTFTNSLGEILTLTITNSTIFGASLNNDNLLSEVEVLS